MEKTRRLPSVERSIKDITEKDFRVRVTGIVVDRNDANSSIMLDDGTGRLIAFFADPDQFAMAEAGRLIRVIGRVRKEENIEIDVEILQDMSKLDSGLYEQVKYLSEKLGGV